MAVDKLVSLVVQDRANVEKQELWEVQELEDGLEKQELQDGLEEQELQHGLEEQELQDGLEKQELQVCISVLSSYATNHAYRPAE